VCTVLDSWWWTEILSETCRVLFQKQIWQISGSRWFYYKNISRCTVLWVSNSYIYIYIYIYIQTLCTRVSEKHAATIFCVGVHRNLQIVKGVTSRHRIHWHAYFTFGIFTAKNIHFPVLCIIMPCEFCFYPEDKSSTSENSPSWMCDTVRYIDVSTESVVSTFTIQDFTLKTDAIDSFETLVPK